MYHRLNINSILVFISSINFFLLILFTFKLLGLNCWVTFHRVTSLKVFELPQIISLIMLFLSSITIIVMFFRGFHKAVLIAPIIPLLYFTLSLDYSILVFSFSTIVLAIFYTRDFPKFIYSIMIVLCIFEGLSLVYWLLLNPLLMKIPLIWDVAYIELLTSSLASSIAPLILIFTLYYWVFKPVIPFKLKLNHSYPEDLTFNFKSILLLSSSLLISIVASIYPYIPSINPNLYPVGVDFKYYSDWLAKFESNPMSIFNVAGGSRPMLIIFLYAFKSLFNFSVKDAVTFFPFILHPLFVASIFLFVFTAFHNIFLASFSALFASMSFKIAVDMYSYFLANMTALILLLLGLTLILKYYEFKSTPIFALALILYNLALLTHPWTYMQFSASIAFMILIKFVKLRSFKMVVHEYLALILMLSPSIPLALILIPYGVDQFQIFLNTVRAMNINSIFNFWYNSFFITFLLYGGFQMNVFTLTTALLALLYPSSTFGDEILRFMVIASSIPYPFVGGSLQSRILFNLPLEVFSSIFIYRVISSEYIGFKMRLCIFSLAVISQLNYLFRCLANVI